MRISRWSSDYPRYIWSESRRGARFSHIEQHQKATYEPAEQEEEA